MKLNGMSYKAKEEFLKLIVAGKVKDEDLSKAVRALEKVSKGKRVADRNIPECVKDLVERLRNEAEASKGSCEFGEKV